MLPIVFITDHNYVFPTCVTLRSLRRTKRPENRYAVHVIGTGLTGTDRDLLKENCPDADIREVALCSLPLTCPTHVSLAALQKFELPLLFPEYDRMLYLDSDLIVRGDLSELETIGLSGFWIGAVSEVLEENSRHAVKMGHTDYFNSGVMLLNLKAWRENHLPEKLLENKLREPWHSFMDQDVLNWTCENKILYLPATWNCTTMHYLASEERLARFAHLTPEEIRALKSSDQNSAFPHIAHFAWVKPWNCLRRPSPFVREWWGYLTPGEKAAVKWKALRKKITSLLIGKKKKSGE